MTVEIWDEDGNKLLVTSNGNKTEIHFVSEDEEAVPELQFDDNALEVLIAALVRERNRIVMLRYRQP